MTKNNKPKIDFFCVGAPKSGTSWLYYCLKEHPEIFLPEKKEINFFSKPFPSYTSDRDFNFNKGFEWYKKYFANYDKNKIIGEFSVNYLNDKNTPSLIRQYYPNSKIIIILRNPTYRFLSHFKYAKIKNKINKIEQKNFFKHPIIKELLSIGYYDESVKRYLKNFSARQILIMYYEN